MKMKLLSSLCVALLFMQLSCKNDNKPDNPPAPITDTLSTGWVSVKAISESIGDVFFCSSTKGYAVTPSRVLKSVDGGNTWSTVDSNYTFLTNIAVTADGKFFAAANHAAIAKSLNEGLTFSRYQFAGANNVNDVFFTNNTTGYTFANNLFFRTTDAGTTWNALASIPGGPFNDMYNSIFILDDLHGWFTLDSMIYRSNGSLNNWVKGDLNTLFYPRQTMSVFPVSTSTVYVGERTGRISKSVDGGANFSLSATLNAGTRSGYLDLHFISPTLGYASFLNKIYKTIDGGINWTAVVTMVSDTFIEIHFTDANHGWACTDNGNIIKYAP